MRMLKPHRAAEQEAFEEAGLKGKIGKNAIGRYFYEKRLANGMTVAVEVSVYPLRVTQRHKRWPEMNQRDGRWFSAHEAAMLVEEESLQALLSAFESPMGTARKRLATKPLSKSEKKSNKSILASGS